MRTVFYVHNEDGELERWVAIDGASRGTQRTMEDRGLTFTFHDWYRGLDVRTFVAPNHTRERG